MSNHSYSTTTSQDATEQWRPVVLDVYRDYYEVSNQGNVRRCLEDGTHRKLTPRNHRQGYLEAKMSVNKREKSVLIHRLVMFAFVGLPPEGMEVNHINGVKSDNRLENLEYVTPKENTRHAIEVMGRRAPVGEATGQAKLTYVQVQEIMIAAAHGETQRSLSRRYGVSTTVIAHIYQRKIWSHVESVFISMPSKPAAICPNCGIQYDGLRKYCSRKCGGTYTARTRRRKNRLNLTTEDIAWLTAIGKA